MKKYILVGLFFVAMIFNVEMVLAKRGCCSHHGGVSGCSMAEKQDVMNMEELFVKIIH